MATGLNLAYTETIRERSRDSSMTTASPAASLRRKRLKDAALSPGALKIDHARVQAEELDAMLIQAGQIIYLHVNFLFLVHIAKKNAR